MTCFCRGGPTCCMRQSMYAPDAAAVVGPFKCPDCGTWWVNEHRCPPSPYSGWAALCACPKGNYVGDWICGVHNPPTTTGSPGMGTT